MSCTEIYGFYKSGYAHHIADVYNSWRGAMAVWGSLEKKYLPSLPPPSWTILPEEKDEYFSRTSTALAGKQPDPMKEIWELFQDSRLKRYEKICLATTFDHAIVMAKDFRECGDALYKFPGETNLREQAAIILNLPSSIKAIGWNCTSVNGDTWANAGPKGGRYNIFKQDRHFDIFARSEIKDAPRPTLRQELGLDA